jgi:indole-3-glycerol phosphate synthase
MSDILSEIIRHKWVELEGQKEAEPLSRLVEKVEGLPPALPFANALRHNPGGRQMALIAEIKKASPSKGLIAPDFNVARIALAYAGANANAMSVLTDEKYFQGHLSYILEAKRASGGKVPVLRKDFMVDEYQLWQARAYGADAILLIMAALDDTTAAGLHKLAGELGLAALVEVHDEEELKRALEIGATIIGINNRNLRTFEVSLKTTERLIARIPAGVTIVSESGIGTRQDIEMLVEMGVHAVLVGESLMRAASGEAGLDIAAIRQKISEMLD